MKNIFILVLLCTLLSVTSTIQAQDYFKERRYDGIDFTKESERKYYVTISRKKYELVDKEEVAFLGQKISFDKKQHLFYIKRQKKAMTFKETINFMKYIGNEKSAKKMRTSLVLHRIGRASRGWGVTGVLLAGFVLLDTDYESINVKQIGLIALGSGVTLYGVGYLLKLKADQTANSAIRYHNKNINKFSKPVIAATDFIPSSLGFKPVRMNLLNPTPASALSMSWSF